MIEFDRAGRDSMASRQECFTAALPPSQSIKSEELENIIFQISSFFPCKITILEFPSTNIKTLY